MKTLIILSFAAISLNSGQAKREFYIDYANDQFIKDGSPWSYVSGSVHYFRVPSYYWRDRLLRMKAGGLNTIQFYVAWNVHEPSPGRFNFDKEADVGAFLDVARAVGLSVVVRVGPYIDSEWDFGGLPWWIHNIPGIRPRSSDPKWIRLVQRYFNVLLPKLVPHLYKNGGPIILTQIENEYGSRSESCDSIEYKAAIRDLARFHFGDDAQLITVDGGALSYLRCGTIPTVYPTVDFGPDSPQHIEKAFNAQRDYAPRGPRVNSEFYPGWLDLWGSEWSASAPDWKLQSSLESFHRLNASFNIYPYEGGSNFGYWPSAYVTTSYDFGAPLTEAGNYTPNFWRIRAQIKRQTGRDIMTPPAPNPAVAFGAVRMRLVGSVLDLLEQLSGPPRRSTFPLNACQLHHPFGFILYQTELLARDGPSRLSVPGLRDRAQVLLGQSAIGTLAFETIGSRKAITQLDISAGNVGRLSLLVENMGRNADGTILDPKGLVTNVTVDGSVLADWTQYSITLENLQPGLPRLIRQDTKSGRHGSSPFVPSIFQGSFHVDTPADSYLDPRGWGKGQVLLNGFNLGRHWSSMGPQQTLYVPKGVFREGSNWLTIFELEGPPENGLVHFQNFALLNGTVH